jgi:putative intracellular protease/amidase
MLVLATEGEGMIMSKMVVVGGVLVFMAAVVWLGLPRLLNALGFHYHYQFPMMDLSGRRALIITTSHGTLGDTGKDTGVFASEMTVPYYAFSDAGMAVDVASIKGGPIPIEGLSLRWPVASASDKRYLDDREFQSKVHRSLEISAVDIDGYDIVFLAGGWGAAYDLGRSAALGEKITEAYANQAVIGGVCHGPLGLLNAKAPDGSPLLQGRRISAVTDKQIVELGVTYTPMHPERDLRAAGAVFEAESKFRDIFATHVVVDGRIVTGQNQNSGAETARKMMETLLATESGSR